MVQLKQKVTLKRKQDVGVTQIKPKSKWWLLLLLVGVIIVGIILIVKNNTSDNTDKRLIAKTEQTIATAKSGEEKQAVNIAQAKIDKAVNVVKATNPVNGAGTKPMDTITTTGGDQIPTDTFADVTIEQRAKEVIRGNYGNGADRKRALGREYDAIQNKVNEMYRKGEVK